jgi:hypothetical protein
MTDLVRNNMVVDVATNGERLGNLIAFNYSRGQEPVFDQVVEGTFL